MNKKIIATLSGIALIAAAALPAQAAEMSTKGVKVGLNLANMSGDDADISGVDKNSRKGFAVGGFATFDLGDNLKLRPEVFYIQKGVNYEAGGAESNIHLSYIDIPILVEFTVAPGKNPVNVFAGVNIGILLSAEVEDSGFPSGNGTVDIKDDTKTLDYGLQFGAGTVVNDQYTVDVRYNMGLSTVDDTSDNADVKNSGILITAGYLF